MHKISPCTKLSFVAFILPKRLHIIRFVILLAAGRRFVLTWPEFEVVHSWYKAYVFVHILALKGGAFVASLAKEGDKVNQDGKEMLTNVVVFLIFLSTGMSVANALHELNEKLKTWNWFKFLVLSVLLPINCVIIKTAYTEKGDGVSKDKKGDYGDHLLILFLISGMLSGITSFIKLVPKESTEPAIDDHDLESGKHDHSDEYKEALVHREISIKTLIIMLENEWNTNQRLTTEIDLLERWVNRVYSE